MQMWITTLSLDLIQCTVDIYATTDPERCAPALRVLFHQVGNVTVTRYHDPAQHPIGDLDSIHAERLASDRVRYRIDTGDAALTFEASSTLQVTFLTPTPVDCHSLFSMQAETPLNIIVKRIDAPSTNALPST